MTDVAGGAIGQATVRVQQRATGRERSTLTGADGHYALSLLPAGEYQIWIEAANFKTWQQADIHLASGERRRVDAQLAPGKLAEVIEISTRGSVVQQDSASLGTLIEERLVAQLPLNGRNFVTLAQLAAGANNSPIGWAAGDGPDDRRSTSHVSVNAQYPWANNFLLDGMDNNERFIGTTIVKPPIAAVREMRVETNLYAAEFGRTAGGVISLVTQSGTNAWHGSLFEYFRNEKLDAKNWLTGAKTPYRLNQFGGSVGGPLRRDRTFFFSDYEGLRQRQGLTFVGTVPTDKMREGDFSDLLLSRNGGVTIYNAQFQPYAGNLVPRSDWDAVGRAILLLYPRATATDRALATNNYVRSATQALDTDAFDARVDHQLTPRALLFGRYSFQDVRSVLPGALPIGDTILGGSAKQRTQGAQFNLLHTFNERWLLEWRAGYSRYRITSLSYNPGQRLADDIGLRGVNLDFLSSGLPAIWPFGATFIGDGIYIPELNTNNVYQTSGHVSYAHGAHSAKFGGEARQREVAQYQSPAPTGWFFFFPFQNGNSFVSLLNGTPFTSASPGRQRQLVIPGYRFAETSLFAQDDWRAARWLTLNLGVRYDYFSPITARHNQISNFDLATGKVIVAGQNGVSATAGVQKDWLNLAPRFGFAATLPRKTFGGETVLRGGYGITFVPPFMGSQGALRNAPFTSNWTPPEGWRLRDGLPLTLTPDDPNQPRGRQNATGFAFQVPYVQQFNLTLQRALPAQLAASVSYVGLLGRKQYFPDLAPDLNSPAAGQTVRPLRHLAPQVTNVQVYAAYGNTSYHALQATLERRFANGLAATANYTWAHAFDNFDYHPTANAQGGIDFVLVKGNSALDVRHRLALLASYELPFARTRRGFVGAVLRGWQTNLIGQWQTSLPFSVVNANPVAIASGISDGTQDRGDQISDPWRAGAVAHHPDAACRSSVAQGGRAPERIGTRAAWFNPCAFAPQRAGTWGNAYRNQLRGPQLVVFDAGLTRKLRVTERVALEVIAQAFNVFNHVNFALPSGSLGNANFGQIAGPHKNYLPRNLQLALKFMF